MFKQIWNLFKLVRWFILSYCYSCVSSWPWCSTSRLQTGAAFTALVSHPLQFLAPCCLLSAEAYANTRRLCRTVGRAPRLATSVGSSILIHMIPGIFFWNSSLNCSFGCRSHGSKKTYAMLISSGNQTLPAGMCPICFDEFFIKTRFVRDFQLATFELSIFNNFHHRYHRPLSTIHYHHWRFFSHLSTNLQRINHQLLCLPSFVCCCIYKYKPH